MSRRKDWLPIIIGHSTRTGIMVFPKRGGRDMVIVGLNKEIPTGQQFDMDDIDWIKAVLHFRTWTPCRLLWMRSRKRWRGGERRMKHDCVL